MAYIFLIIWLVAASLFVWGLIAPHSLARLLKPLTKQTMGRKKLSFIFGLLGVVSFVMIGVTAPPQPKSSQVKGSSDEPAKTITVKEEAPRPVPQEKTETTTEPVTFGTSTIDDASLAKGQTKVKTAGINGTKTITWKVTYVDGKETAREKASEAVTTKPVDQVVAHGTYVAPASAPAASSSGGARVGAICRDGWHSSATGSGACSHHGGVARWLYN